MRQLAVTLVLAAGLLAGCAHTGSRQEQDAARGWIQREELLSSRYEQFKTAYDTVQVQAPFMAMLRGLTGGVQTLVFLGTWCPDSRREVPRFLKVADSAGIPPDSVRLYAVDRTKTSGDGMTARYGITLVPTFIFLKEGKEVGRITEVPQATVEQDMVTILAKAATGG